eukprot:TRINITY_DN4625_c0_g1_i1.p1 TRINITY_DN4625_c0_g1~~TRINITY_DN4625_c0_g1_i1.p1  ORF type:complete len:73 (-),score=25.40 TRINITY_DN4625_c0_g1_i1:27-245(-)
MDKLQEVEKYHAGFSGCVINFVTNNPNANYRYGKGMLTRAKNCLRNKRNKVGWSESDTFQKKEKVPTAWPLV